jgi:hypothetical protein
MYGTKEELEDTEDFFPFIYVPINIVWSIDSIQFKLVTYIYTISIIDRLHNMHKSLYSIRQMLTSECCKRRRNSLCLAGKSIWVSERYLDDHDDLARLVQNGVVIDIG